MKIVTGNPGLKTGSKADITRSKMQKEGYAGPTESFGFKDAKGNHAQGAPQAAALEKSVGQYAAAGTQGAPAGESAVYGVSVMGGYHSMTLTVSTTVIIPSFQIPFTDVSTPALTATTFTLSDQGTAMGTIGKGNITFNSAAALDSHLVNYVQANSSATTSNGSSYKALIELHQIINKE